MAPGSCSGSSASGRGERRRRRAQASPHQAQSPPYRQRHRRRDDVDDRPADAKRTRRERSRSSRRHRRHKRDRKNELPKEDRGTPLQPPSDWRGPMGAPPPPDWRGPADFSREWRPPAAHPAAYPRWYTERPMSRPMSFPPGPMPPGQFPQRPMPPPNGQMRPEYSWHMAMGAPDGWRGPTGMQRPPYGHWGSPGDGSVSGFPPVYRPQQGEPDAQSKAAMPRPESQGSVASRAATGSGAGGTDAAQGSISSSLQSAPGDAGAAAGAAGFDDDEDPLPPLSTVAERLRGVRIVRSALSERMLSRLRSAGVAVDGDPSGQQQSVASGLDEATASDEAPVAAAAAHQRCIRLGLENPSTHRAKLPPAPSGPPRLPACTASFTHPDLWERFKAKCGESVPADTPPIPCELRTSRGGGHVVVPLIIPAGGSLGV